MIASLGWSRFEGILDATVKRADPAGARAVEGEAASRRFVVVGRANDHHIKTLIARGTSLDISSFMAAVNRVADLLAAEGDTDLVEVRRSKAVGVLARPAHALALLARHEKPGPVDAAEPEPDHEHGPEPEPEQDVEPDPEEDGHLSSPLVSPYLRAAGHRCGCAPRLVLHVHLTDAALSGADLRAVCRVEGVGPVTAVTVRDWLGRSDVKVSVQPVVVPDPPPVDGYEIPQAIRDAVAARHPGSVYPWSNAAGPQVDLDHTIAYVPAEQGGPPGQTAAGKLGPLARREHLGKTFGHWKVRQPAARVFFWRSRHGWVWLATNTGTHPLGRSPTAHALWQAAAPRGRSASGRTPSAARSGSGPRHQIDLVRPRAEAQLIMRT